MPLLPMESVAQTESTPETSSGSSVWARAATLFSRWRDQGEPEALDELVRGFSPVLWHVVRAYGLDRERAEDVVQTTWLAFVRRHASIEQPQAVGAWLTTTARREAWRVSRLESTATAVEDEILERWAPDEESAETEVVAGDEHSRLWTQVHELSQRCQRLLRIVAFDDRPDYARIAKDLDMPIGSIGPTRGRCLAKLRDALTAAEGGHHE